MNQSNHLNYANGVPKALPRSGCAERRDVGPWANQLLFSSGAGMPLAAEQHTVGERRNVKKGIGRHSISKQRVALGGALFSTKLLLHGVWEEWAFLLFRFSLLFLNDVVPYLLHQDLLKQEKTHKQKYKAKTNAFLCWLVIFCEPGDIHQAVQSGCFRFFFPSAVCSVLEVRQSYFHREILSYLHTSHCWEICSWVHVAFPFVPFSAMVCIPP